MKKLLPIGSVVLLAGGTKEVMITGYKSKASDDAEVMDYNGCIFPEGFMENKFLLFNHDQIDEILYEGYYDEEFEDYSEKIKLNTGSVASSGFESSSAKNDDKKRYRTPKAPTKPMSKSDMMKKYGVAKVSSADGSGRLDGGK